MWGTSHIMRARRWLNLGNVAPVICDQAELILCNMVAPTVPVKSGGVGEGSEGTVPRNRALW